MIQSKSASKPASELVAVVVVGTKKPVHHPIQSSPTFCL